MHKTTPETAHKEMLSLNIKSPTGISKSAIKVLDKRPAELIFQPALYDNKNPNSMPTTAKPNRKLAQFTAPKDLTMFASGTNIKKETIDTTDAQTYVTINATIGFSVAGVDF